MKYLPLIIFTVALYSCQNQFSPTVQPLNETVKTTLEDEDFFSNEDGEFPIFSFVKQYPTIADSGKFLEKISIFLPEEADFNRAKVLNFVKIGLSGRADSLYQVLTRTPQGLFAFCFTKKGENLYASRVMSAPKLLSYKHAKDTIEQKVFYSEELLDGLEGTISIYASDSLGLTNLIDEIVPNQPTLLDSLPGTNLMYNVPAAFRHEFRDVNGDGYLDLTFKGQHVKGGKVSIKNNETTYIYLFNPIKGTFIFFK